MASLSRTTGVVGPSGRLQPPCVGHVAAPLQGVHRSRQRLAAAPAAAVLSPQADQVWSGGAGQATFVEANWDYGSEDTADFNQYKEATSAVTELRDLTGDLLAQLAELERVSTSLDAGGLELSPASTSSTDSAADKAVRKARRQAQRAARKAKPETAAAKAAPTASSVPEQPSVSTSASLHAPVSTPASISALTAKSSTSALRSSLPTPGLWTPESPQPTDLAILEKSWVLPPGQDVLPVVQPDFAPGEGPSHEAEALTSIVAAPGTRPADLEQQQHEDEEMQSVALTSILVVAAARSLPAGPSLLSLPAGLAAAPQAAGGTGEATQSEWGRLRQARRSQNYGRAALAATAAAAAAPSTSRAASSAGRGGQPSGDASSINSFMKRAGASALLTSDEEKSLMEQVKDWRFLQDARRQLRAALQREPSPDEWAMVVQTDVGSFVARLQAGDAARQRIISANHRLVMSIAKKYVRPGREMADLIATGANGLYKAVDRFDAGKGFRFSTYATWWIRQSIMRSLTDQGRAVRLPSHIVEQVSKLRSVQAQLTKELGGAPSDEDIAAAMKLPVAKVQHLIGLSAETSSLDIPAAGSEEGDCVKDTLEATQPGADEYLQNQALAQDLKNLLKTLEPREAGVLAMRYGLDDTGEVHTLDTVGRRFKITRERVRQIESKAIRKLRARADEARVIVSEYNEHADDMELAARNSRGTHKS